jgi:hypothetical protein
MGPLRRMFPVAVLACAFVLGTATAALAHTVEIKIDCDSVDVKFGNFPSGPGHSATITIDGSARSTSWSGSTHSVSYAINPPNGHQVSVQVAWTSNEGRHGSASASKTLYCQQPSPSPSPTHSPSPSPSPTHSPSPSPSPTHSPSPSPSPTHSPSPSPTPTGTPSPTPTGTPTTPPPTTPPVAPPTSDSGDDDDVAVQGQGVGQGPSGQAGSGAAAPAESGALAFTGGAALPAVGGLALFLFLTGSTLLWRGRYRGGHRSL